MTKFVQWVFFINIHLSILSIGWSEQPIWRGGDSANIRLHCSRIHWKTREEPPSSSLNLLGIGMIRGGSEPAGLATTCDDTNVDCGRDDNEPIDINDGEDSNSNSGSDSEQPISVAGGSVTVEPFFMPPSVQLYTTFGCIILSRRLDFSNPYIVRILRFAFLAQIITQQVFIFYVRLKARKSNDKSSVEVQNPLSGILKSRFKEDGELNSVVKNLASSFLLSETTAMEYDLRQAANMQGGVMSNLIIMWFLHFKLEKVQPLLIQAVNGFLQLFYSPLFQCYAMGRNLERPFKPLNASNRVSTLNNVVFKDGDDRSAANDSTLKEMEE